MNADGSGVARLTNSSASDAEPAWSPDGTKIAFFSFRGGNQEIYTMNADGTGQTNLSNHQDHDFYPDWQPLPFKNVSKKCKAFPGEYRNHGQCVKGSK